MLSVSVQKLSIVHKTLALASWLLLGASASASQSQPQVVVSFQPLYDVAKNVAGQHAHVERMAPAGASPHHFDPTVRDIARMQKANLAIVAGFNADAWLEKYTRKNSRLLRVGEKIKFTPIKSGKLTDPHWWLDSSLMAKAALAIGEEMAQIAPQHATSFRKNARKEAQKLQELHSELKKDLAPLKGQKIVTFHNAFGYFARAYGLKVAATVAPMHGLEPSAKSVANAVKVIRQAKVKAVFSEPQLPAAPAQAVTKEAKVKLFVLDPAGKDNNTSYINMMRNNKNSLLQALR